METTCGYLADLREQIRDIHKARLAAISRGDYDESARLDREHVAAWKRFTDAQVTVMMESR